MARNEQVPADFSDEPDCCHSHCNSSFTLIVMTGIILILYCSLSRLVIGEEAAILDKDAQLILLCCRIGTIPYVVSPCNLLNELFIVENMRLLLVFRKY